MGTLSSQADLSAALAAKAAASHSHAEGDVTGLTAALAAKAPLASPAFTGTPTGISKSHVGLGSVDNTSDAAKPVSTAQQTALDLKAPLASPAFTGTPTGISKAHVGLGNADNTSDANKPISSAVAAVLVQLAATYRTVLQAAGSHIAARVAGTYGLGLGDPAAITGVGTLYPLAIIRIDAADFPTIGVSPPKFRIKWSLAVNDVAPTGNFTFGLHPVTRPATSGGAGLAIFTIGAAVVGSTSAVNAPAVDSMNTGASADFALPSDGYYVIGVVTTATVAASSHLHLSAQLQARNV